MAYLKIWRKRKRELDQLLQDSDSDDSLPGIPNAFDSDSEPGSTISLDSLESCSDDNQESADLEHKQNDEEVNVNLEDDLKQWATKNRETHRSVNELLSILIKQGHSLPMDARTLLSTPQDKTSVGKCGGQYKYYGLEKGIHQFLSQTASNAVHLSVNIDGIPLFKSSGIQFWPILAKFSHFDPFIVAIFCGQKKPSPLEEFLSDFLNEYKHLQDNGISYEDQTYTVQIEALICDAPARAYLKCIKNHNAYDSCERCVIRGEHVEGRIVFSEQECCLRTDEAFSRKEYSSHQTGVSPLIPALIPCVSSFVLDYMHIVILGVVRRLMLFLTKGPNHCRLSVRQKGEISQKLNALRGKMPSEFARQPRGLHDLDRWKATELRQFLLYTGPVVLKDVLSPEKYSHFLSLTVSMSIMLESDDKIRNAYLQFAQELMKHFVMCSADLYGKCFPVYNVHGLLHLHEDVRHFNRSLNEISCFPFENHLQKIKKCVRNGKSPLEQVTRRLSEIEHAENNNLGKTQHATQPVLASLKEKDSCFLLKDESFAFIQEKNADGTFVCKILNQRYTTTLFHQPCSSKLLNIVCTRNGQGRMKRGLLHKTDLIRKVACLSQETGGYVLIPLRHGMEHKC